MRKHRGLRRYYKNLETKNDLDAKTWLNVNDPDTWLQNWHWHFDYRGYGNNSFKKRKLHLDKLFRYFDLLVDQAKPLQFDFQLYTIILDFDSGSDALFLHTPNQPYNSQFPFKIESLSKASTLTNKALDAYIENLDGYEKLYGIAREAFCLLYVTNVGEPF